MKLPYLLFAALAFFPYPAFAKSTFSSDSTVTMRVVSPANVGIIIDGICSEGMECQDPLPPTDDSKEAEKHREAFNQWRQMPRDRGEDAK